MLPSTNGARMPASNSRVRNIVLCCDGTWCGSAAGTTSNIKILADSFAEACVTSCEPVSNHATNTVVCFFDGLGVSGTFGDYLVDGALALGIKARCVEAYRFIVENYQENAKIWLFGLSRGAHTVRMVAGMIRNCGILKAHDLPMFRADDDGGIITQACELVYAMFIERDPDYHPDQEIATAFRRRWSYAFSDPPIRFMGLLDTVGALGVPRLGSPAAQQYEFIDQIVSSDVQTVCQALATHDRLRLFQPCFARRTAKKDRKPRIPEYKTQPDDVVEVWFPGSHYDIGRQRFRFPRDVPGPEGWVYAVTTATNLLRINIDYTASLSNAPLLWMIARIKLADPGALRLTADDCLKFAMDESPKGWMSRLIQRLTNPVVTTDAYDMIYSALRLLHRLFPFVNSLLERWLLADRRVPLHPRQTFYCNDLAHPELTYTKSSGATKKYTSHSFQQYMLFKCHTGDPLWLTRPFQNEEDPHPRDSNGAAPPAGPASSASKGPQPAPRALAMNTQ